MSQHKYSDCSYCKGVVSPAKVKVDMWWKDKLYVLEEVPAGVCQQCGEQFFTAKVAKSMEYSIRKNQFKKFIEVPISSFTQIVSAS